MQWVPLPGCRLSYQCRKDEQDRWEGHARLPAGWHSPGAPAGTSGLEVVKVTLSGSFFASLKECRKVGLVQPLRLSPGRQNRYPCHSSFTLSLETDSLCGCSGASPLGVAQHPTCFDFSSSDYQWASFPSDVLTVRDDSA